MACRRLTRMRSSLTLLCLANACAMLSVMARAGGSDFRKRYCDEEYTFSPSEDLNFIEMLDNLLEESRSTFSKVEVKAKDRDGRFEGRAGCLWHNCQIYDGECYDCHSTRDSAVCIENLVKDLKQGLQERNSYCQRTRKFASGERSVAVDDASTSFQVCGLQYRYLGKDVDEKAAF